VFCYQLLPLGGDFSAELDGDTARLHIHQVYPEDEGEYTCVAYNELGRALTSACLVVDGKNLDLQRESTYFTDTFLRPISLISPHSYSFHLKSNMEFELCIFLI
jgi:hypothetical protein